MSGKILANLWLSHCPQSNIATLLAGMKGSYMDTPWVCSLIIIYPSSHLISTNSLKILQESAEFIKIKAKVY